MRRNCPGPTCFPALLLLFSVLPLVAQRRLPGPSMRRAGGLLFELAEHRGGGGAGRRVAELGQRAARGVRGPGGRECDVNHGRRAAFRGARPMLLGELAGPAPAVRQRP